MVAAPNLPSADMKGLASDHASVTPLILVMVLLRAMSSTCAHMTTEAAIQTLYAIKPEQLVANVHAIKATLEQEPHAKPSMCARLHQTRMATVPNMPRALSLPCCSLPVLATKVILAMGNCVL
jgi:hypothetical protein